MTRLRNLLLAATIMSTTAPALAQTSGNVVMRRPLPFSKTVVSDQTEIPNPTPTPTPTPGTPTPSPTPTASTPTPSPTPSPPSKYTGEFTTETVQPDPAVPPRPGVFGYYDWTVGDWQGTKQCGVQTVLTRKVQCTYVFFDPKNNYQQETSPAADSSCRAENRPTQSNTFRGDGAGCAYHIVKIGVGSWEGGTDYAGNPIDATCSRDAKRRINYECRDQDEAVVDMAFCTSGIDAANTTEAPPEYETGNFSGCTYAWEMDLPRDYQNYAGMFGEKLYGEGAGDFHYCGQAGDTSGTSGVQGPVLFVHEVAYCTRSDGMNVDDDQCQEAGPKPESGPRARGTCHHAFHIDGSYNTTQEACVVDGGAQVLVRSTLGEQSAEPACNAAIAAGATCCSTRRPLGSGDWTKEEIIATNGQKQKVGNGDYYSIYTDEGKQWRTSGSSNLEYNSDTCVLTNEAGKVIYTLQPYMCI